LNAPGVLAASPANEIQSIVTDITDKYAPMELLVRRDRRVLATEHLFDGLLVLLGTQQHPRFTGFPRTVDQSDLHYPTFAEPSVGTGA
jgi:hypothetical protein